MLVILYVVLNIKLDQKKKQGTERKNLEAVIREVERKKMSKLPLRIIICKRKKNDDEDEEKKN